MLIKKDKARITPGFVTSVTRTVGADSVGLTAQEGRNFDAFLIGGQFLLVVIGGHRRLLAACQMRGAFVALIVRSMPKSRCSSRWLQ